MTSRPLESADQTAAEMVRLVRTYSGDLGEKGRWPLNKFFRHVAELEYRPDPKGHESVSRPALSMSENWPWRDCDDKAVMMGAWCYQNQLPFKFVGSSKRPDHQLHHVWVKARIDGKDLPLDATYNKNYVGYADPKNTIVIPLTGEIMPATLNTFEGDELLGSTFAQRMARRSKNLARQTGNIARQTAPVLDIVAPGLSSRLQSISSRVQSKAAQVQAAQASPAAPADSVDSVDVLPSKINSSKKPIWKNPKFIALAGGAAVLLFVLTRKKA